MEAWRLYDVPKSVILFLVEDVTYNICDQKFHEFEIRRQCPEVFVIRKTLTDLAKRGYLTKVRRMLMSRAVQCSVKTVCVGQETDDRR